MKTTLRNAHITDPHSPYHNLIADILVSDDQILAVGEGLKVDGKTKEIDLKGKRLSPGWVEMHSHFADPGNEEREDLLSGSAAALRGGYSTVCLVPATKPVIESKSDIEYIYSKSAVTPVNLLPYGALSVKMQGEEMTEMYDMWNAGAVGFFDHKNSVANPNLLKLSLLYAKPHGMAVLNFPFETQLAVNGQVTEGHTGTYLGMKGIPNLSEELIVARDLELCAYTEGKLHFASISTAGSVERIRQARAMGQNVSCDVNLYNLLLTEGTLHEYDTNFKVLPPLRSEDDRKALISGVLDGTIDIVSVDHIPHDIESKMCEFEHALFGMAYLEHAFGLYGADLMDQIPLERWIECTCHAPREVLGLGPISIVEGAPAEFTVFDTDIQWTDEKANTASRAYNQPFIGRSLKGKAIGIFNKGNYFKV